MATEVKNDPGDIWAGVIDRLRDMPAALISECLDEMGLRDQAMLPRIRPLYPEANVVGVAFTLEVVEVDRASEGTSHRRQLWETIEQLGPGDVLVVSTANGTYMGEYMAKASQQHGAAGIVMDAWVHDAPGIIKAAIPTFATAVSVIDMVGRVEFKAHGVPITCGGVQVHPGDLIVGDYDGVVVVPRGSVDEVLERGEGMLETEKIYERAFAEGKSLSTLFLDKIAESERCQS